jgi:acetyltransferase-like isoleucine patch superfamily enzyme
MNNWVVGEGSKVVVENTNDLLKKKIGIHCGENCEIFIHGLIANNTMLNISMSDHCKLIIGSNQLINGLVQINMHEPSEIIIGSDCLWANTTLWTSDMHSIIDTSTGSRINRAKSILIGNKVWLGYNSLILKGSVIPDGSIIGAHAVVTSSTKILANSLVAGNPAKVLRNNVTWDVNLVT